MTNKVATASGGDTTPCFFQNSELYPKENKLYCCEFCKFTCRFKMRQSVTKHIHNLHKCTVKQYIKVKCLPKKWENKGHVEDQYLPLRVYFLNE